MTELAIHTTLTLQFWYALQRVCVERARAITVLAVGARAWRRRRSPVADGVVLGPTRIAFDSEGMRVDEAKASTLTRWRIDCGSPRWATA
jgi:hypothetical protein